MIINRSFCSCDVLLCWLPALLAVARGEARGPGAFTNGSLRRRSNFFTKFRDSLLLDLLQESLQVRRLVVEELNLFLTLLAFDFTTRCVARLDGFNLALELDDFV